MKYKFSTREFLERMFGREGPPPPAAADCASYRQYEIQTGVYANLETPPQGFSILIPSRSIFSSSAATAKELKLIPKAAAACW